MRFEDVVTSPDETLGGLFAFLGVEAPPDPTNVKVMARGFKWGAEGLDADAADRWREHIGGVGNRWMLRWHSAATCGASTTRSSRRLASLPLYSTR